MAEIEVKNIKKSFGTTKALDGISLSLNKGKILGLLGPNGAGKTTLVRILTTLLKPDSGEANVSGVNVIKHPQSIRETIGLAGQYAAVDGILTGQENLEMVASLYHIPRNEAKKRAKEVLNRMGLSAAADRQVKTYSGGMRRRLDLGASFIFRPSVLFLDEPTTGLDPETRISLWEIIEELVSGGTTLLLTTQYLEEADKLADEIAVIDRGKLIAEGTPAELKKRHGGDVLELELKNPSDMKKAQKTASDLKLHKNKPTLDPKSHHVILPVTNGPDDLLTVINKFKKENISVSHLSLKQPSLDDVFLSLTGKKIEAGDKGKGKGVKT